MRAICLTALIAVAAIGAERPSTTVRLRGRVLLHGRPVAGARIATADHVLGTTTADGTFEVELPEVRPPQLRISKASLGTKVVALARGTADLVVPSVEMVRASSLQVRVDGAPGAVDLLMRQGPQDGEQVDVAARHLRSPGSPVTFDRLDAGDYTLVVAGADPLARHATSLRLGEGERRTLKVRIAPRRVEGMVQWGERPLPDVTLQFHNETFGWTSKLAADSAGRFASEMWQPGDFMIGVSRGALHNLYVTQRPVDAGPMTVVVPVEKIRGRVIDGASGRGVPGAHVSLQTKDEIVTSTLRQASDAEGAFVFDALPAAQGVLNVTADNYLIPGPIEIAADPEREVVVQLDSGRGWAALVVDDRGRPLPHAVLIAASGNDLRAITTTDPSGRATLPLPLDPVLVYVLAPKGGVAVVNRLEVDRVEMPAASSSLRMIARSTLGTPRLPPVSFLMSVNGWMIPPKVAEWMTRLQRFSLRTDESSELNLPAIPPGLYQFWPYEDGEEAEAIFKAQVEAPIAISVNSGPNVAVVDFQSIAIPPPLQLPRF